MKTTILTIVTVLIISISSGAHAQKWELTRFIINEFGEFPTDTATRDDLQPFGSLHINNNRVSMFVRLCSTKGAGCGDQITFFDNHLIEVANENVAFIGGSEVNILQISPSLIISLHVPFIGTDISFSTLCNSWNYLFKRTVYLLST